MTTVNRDQPSPTLQSLFGTKAVRKCKSGEARERSDEEQRHKESVSSAGPHSQMREVEGHSVVLSSARSQSRCFTLVSPCAPLRDDTICSDKEKVNWDLTALIELIAFHANGSKEEFSSDGSAESELNLYD